MRGLLRVVPLARECGDFGTVGQTASKCAGRAHPELGL